MKLKSYLSYVLSLVIFGTIGIFVVNIPASRPFVSLIRGAVGALFLLVVSFVSGKRPSPSAIKKNLLPLLVSGALIGANWILLFESYKHASVAASTLIYYLAPVFVLFLSAIFLGEKITVVRAICAALAVIGMLLITGTGQGSVLALGAALLYAGAILVNKRFIRDISSLDTTIMQLGFAALTILPYTLLTENIFVYRFTAKELALLILLGVLHTGVAYLLYFYSVKRLKGQTVAIVSYVDPTVAVILSFIIEKSFTPIVLIGAIVIILSAVLSELYGDKIKIKKQKNAKP